MNTFNEVIEAINTERLFQDKKVADPDIPSMIDLQMGSTLAAIKVNLDRAFHTWYSDSEPYILTTDLLRKIAGLCVQAGEKFGMPKRVF